jgi:uncharacterized RDD family membrane protein YckC
MPVHAGTRRRTAQGPRADAPVAAGRDTMAPPDDTRGPKMSENGAPPDPQNPEPGQGGADQQQPYNPYPDQWNAPPSPYHEPNPYGQQQSPYPQQPPYGPTGAPVNPYAGSPSPNKPVFGFGGFAPWFSRVAAYLIDSFLGALAAAPLWIGEVLLFSDTTTTTDAQGVEHIHFQQTGTAVPLIVVGALTYLAFTIWNVYIRQGRTGASIGKSVMAIRLVNADMQPIGGGWCFLRAILHIVDALPCYIGFFWPIWDAQRQTFADKIMSTYVIHATQQEQVRVY